MRVISIQSQVGFGHVGNSAAAFPVRSAADVAVAKIRNLPFANLP